MPAALGHQFRNPRSRRRCTARRQVVPVPAIRRAPRAGMAPKRLGVDRRRTTISPATAAWTTPPSWRTSTRSPKRAAWSSRSSRSTFSRRAGRDRGRRRIGGLSGSEAKRFAGAYSHNAALAPTAENSVIGARGRWQSCARPYVCREAATGDFAHPTNLQSLQRLDRPLAVDRDPFAVLLHRLHAELLVEPRAERRLNTPRSFRQQLMGAPEQHAHAVVLSRLRVQGEPLGIAAERGGEAGQQADSDDEACLTSSMPHQSARGRTAAAA